MDLKQRVPNPNPHRSQTITLSTLINYAGDSSYPFQQRAIEILDSLRNQGVVDDKEVEKAKKSQKETGKDAIGEEGIKQDDIILELSDGTQLTKELLNTPNKLSVVEKNKNNLNFLILIPHIDEDDLYKFADSDAPQIRKAVAERIPIEELNRFFNEDNTSVLDIVVDRISSIDGEKLLKRNRENLSFDHVEELTRKIDEMNDFGKLLEEADTITDNMFEKINALQGADFDFVMETLRPKLEEDKDFNFTSKLNPEKLAEYFSKEIETDGQWNPETSIQKEERTGKVKVYRGGEFKNGRGYVSLDKSFAEEFGTADEWEIDKSKVLDLTNSTHRTMIELEFGSDMLDKLSPDGELPFAGDENILNDIERVSKKLGFVGSAQSEGEGLSVSFDIYDSSKLDFPTPDRLDRPSIFGSDAESVGDAIEKLSKQNYEGLLDIASEAKDKDNELFNKNPKLREKIASNLKPEDVATFADDEDKQVRLKVAERIEDKLAREYASGEADPQVLAKYIEKLRDGDITDEMMFHSDKDVRIATSEVIKHPMKLERMLKHETGLERGNPSVLGNILNSFEPEQFKSIVEPLYNKEYNWDLKNALGHAIRNDKFKSPDDFKNLEGFIKADADPVIFSALIQRVPEELADEYFTPDIVKEHFDNKRTAPFEISRMVQGLTEKQSVDNVLENINTYIDYADPSDINSIAGNSKLRKRFEEAGRIDDYNSMLDGLVSYSKNPMIPRYSHTPISVSEASNKNDVYVYRRISKAELDNVLSGKDKTGEFWTSAPQAYPAGKEGDYRVVSVADKNAVNWLGGYLRPENTPVEVTYEGLKAVRKENSNYKAPSKATTHFEQISARTKDDIVAIYDHKGNLVYSRDKEIIPDFSQPKFQPIHDGFGKAITYANAENIVRQYFNDDEIDVQRATRIFTEHRAFGVYINGVIGFVENPDISTPYHESVHAYLDNFYTYDEKQELYDEIRKLEKDDTLSDKDTEEKLADMFFPYVQGKKTLTGKIKDYFDKAINFVKGLVGKEDKIKRLFNDIESKKRPISNVKNKIKDPVYEAQLEYYQQPKALTTKLFKMRETQKETMSMQEVQDLIKSKVANLKKPEKELLNRVLHEQFRNQKRIKVEDFENAVAQSLVPLTIKQVSTHSNYGMENIDPNGELKIDAENTNIYEFPVSNGVSGHFSGETDKLFGHTRVWDTDDASYVAEIQSDFFQKYRDKLENYGPMATVYKNTWHERMIREEIRNSAVKGKESIRFPHPYTVAMIEGYVTGRAPYQSDSDDYVGHGTGIKYLGKDYIAVDLDYGEFTAVKYEFFEDSFNINDRYKEEIYDSFVDAVQDRGFNKIDLIKDIKDIPVDSFTSTDGKTYQYNYDKKIWENSADKSDIFDDEDVVNDYNNILEAQNKFASNVKKEILKKETNKFLSFASDAMGKTIDEISDLSQAEYTALRQDYLRKNKFDIQVGFFSQWDWNNVNLNNYKSELDDAISDTNVGSAQEYFEKKYGDLIKFDTENNDEYAVLLKEGWHKETESFKLPHMYEAGDIDEDEYIDNIEAKYNRINKKKSFLINKTKVSSVREIPLSSFTRPIQDEKIEINRPYSTEDIVGQVLNLRTGHRRDLTKQEAIERYNAWIEDASKYDIEDKIKNQIEYHEKVDASENVVLFYKKQVIPYIKSNRADLKEVHDENGNTWYETKLTTEDRGAVEAFQEFAPAFYSRLEGEVKNIQGENIKVKRIPNLLRNISQDEIKWSGLEDFIKENAVGGKINKQALVDYLKENNTKVDLKFGTPSGFRYERPVKDKPEITPDMKELMNDFSVSQIINGISSGEFHSLKIKDIESLINNAEFTNAEFNELLNSLEESRWSIDIYEENKLTDKQKEIFFGGDYANRETRKNYVQDLGGKYVEAVVTSNKAIPFETDPTHFGEQQDQISWFRGQTLEHPELGKLLHIDEIQSRRHDKGKEEGYKLSQEQYNREIYDIENEIKSLVKEKQKILNNKPDLNKYVAKDKEEDSILNILQDLLDSGHFTDAMRFINMKNINNTDFGKDILNNWTNPLRKIQDELDRMNFKASKLENERDYSSLPTMAPFEDYAPITLKNALRYCAENQIDGITLSTPNQIKDLYNLANVISKVNAIENKDGTFRLDFTTPEGDGVADDEGYRNVSVDRMKELIGNELTDKIINKKGKEYKTEWNKLQYGSVFFYNGELHRVDNYTKSESGKEKKVITAYNKETGESKVMTKKDYEENAVPYHSYEGEDLRLGGEWADEMYGKKIPNWLNKYMKKLGIQTQLEEREIKPGFVQPYLKITGELSNKVLSEGQSLFQKNPYQPAIEELLKSTPQEEWSKFYNHENEYMREAVVQKIDSGKLGLFMDDESPIVRDALYGKVKLEELGLLYDKDSDVNSLPALRQRLAQEMLKDGFDPTILWQFTNSKDPLLAEIAQSVDFTDKESIIEASERLKDEDNMFANERGIEEPDVDKIENAEKEYKEPDTEEKIEVDESDYDVDPTLSPEIKLQMVSDVVIEDGIGEAYKLKNMLDEMQFQRTDRETELKEKINDRSNWKRLSGRDYSIPLRDAEKVQFKIMNNMLTEVKSIVGDDIHLVGGATRDLLMRQAGITDKIVNDLDFSVPKYEQIEKLNEYFQNHPEYGVDDSGLKFSHIKVIHKKTKFEFEFSSYRKEAYHDTSRKPDVVEGTFDDELKRRDFTINTIYAKIDNVDENGVSLSVDERTEDFIDDINNGIIRTYNDADTVFYDDPLRLLRALRFASRYNFEIDPNVVEAIQRFDPKIFNKVSGERIKDEFSKVLRTGNDMFANQIIAKVFPELNELYEQSDVIDHINRAVKLARKYDDDVLLWTAMLHDVGKMKTATKGKEGQTIHPGHAEASSELIKPILDRLKLSRFERKAIEKLVSIHSRYKELDKMNMGKVIDFAIENEKLFPYLVKFQDIDYFAHAGNFFNNYPEQTNFDIISRMSGIYSVLKQIPAEEKSKWEGADFRNKLKNYISNNLKYREAYEQGATALYKLYDKKEPIVNETYLAPNGEQSELTQGQWKQTRTPEFKTWFGDWQNDPENASKVVDENGEPKVVYHGTMSDIEEFDINKISIANQFGRGIYFSDSTHDVNKNYTEIDSPDRRNRIEMMEEKVYNEIGNLSDEEKFERFGLTNEERKELERVLPKLESDNFDERQEYHRFVSKYTSKHVNDEAIKNLEITNQGNVMPMYIDMKNPAIIDDAGEESTMIQLNLEFDDEDNLINESGNALELQNAILSVAPDFDLRGDDIWDSLMTMIGDKFYDGVGLDEIDKTLRTIDELLYAQDDDSGELANQEFIRRVYEYMGFDGIIQKNANLRYPRMGMKLNTTHYVAFNPNQAKSSIANKGTFTKSNNVLYQQRARGDEKYPTLTPAETKAYSEEAYRMLQGVIPVKLEDMDRDNGKAVLNGLQSIMTVDPRTAHEGTFYHETLHIATEVLGEKEAWNQFLKEAGWDGIDGSKSWTDAQEKLADEFMEYKLGRKEYEENHPVKAMFDRMSDFFKKIGDFFTGKKEYNKADYFYKLSKGKLGLRSTFEKDIKNYPIASQIAHQRNMSIPAEIRDKVINTELKSFGKNPSGKPILRGKGGLLQLNDDFYKHLQNDGVKNTEIDFIKFIVESEDLENHKISPENMRTLISQYLYPMKIENSYGEVFFELPDDWAEKYEGYEEIYQHYKMEDGKIYGSQWRRDGWEEVNEKKLPIDIVDAIYKSREGNDYTNYYGIKGAMGYGLQAQGGEAYRELRLTLPFEIIDSHPEFATKNMLGWFRTDIDAKNPRRLRINELQSDVFQKTKMPKEFEDVKVGDKYKYLGKEYIVIHKYTKEETGDEGHSIIPIEKYPDFLANPDKHFSEFKDIVMWKDKYDREREFSVLDKENSKLLLNLQPTWHEYFIKSIMQNAYDNNFDEVAFPTGDTVGNIEGFNRIDEAIEKNKQEFKELEREEKIWKTLDEKLAKITDKEDLLSMDIDIKELRFLLERWDRNYWDSELTDLYDSMWEDLNLIKKKLHSNKEKALIFAKKGKVETSLKHYESAKKTGDDIKRFYENKIGKYLQRIKKGSVETVTDEYGQTWFNVSLNEQDGSPVELFQRKSFNKMFRLSLKGIKDAVSRVLENNIDLKFTWNDWFSNRDEQAKAKISHYIQSNPELKNALINNFYQSYVDMIKTKNKAIKENPELGNEIETPSFEEFLTMEIPVYSMGIEDTNAFESVSLIKPVSEEPITGEEEQRTIVPIKTMGLVDKGGTSEILIPTQMTDEEYQKMSLKLLAESQNMKELANDSIVREKEKAGDYKGVYERMLDLKLNKGQLKIGITPATGDIEEISKLLKRSEEFSQKGNFNKVKQYNAQVLEFGKNWFDEKFEGKIDASFEINDSIGLFGEWEEPTMDMSVSFDEKNKKEILNSMIDFAEDFKQNNIHISKSIASLPEGASLGEINEDGSTYQMEYNISFKKSLTKEQINDLVDKFNKNDLPGFILNENNDSITFYNTTTEGEKGYEGFIKNSAKLIKDIQSFEDFGNVSQGFRQLWNWGNTEFGATATFEQARNQIFPQSEEEIVSSSMDELISNFKKFEKPSVEDIGVKTDIKLSDSTKYEITPLGDNMINIAIEYDGVHTDTITLYGGELENFKKTMTDISKKQKEILNKYTKGDYKKLFPFYDEIKDGSLIYADGDMFYVSTKTEDAMSVAQIGKDGAIISYKPYVTVSDWEQSFSGLNVNEKAPKDILNELDFDSLVAGSTIESPFFDAKFTVIENTGDSIRVKFGDDDREMAMSRKYINRYTQRSAYANKIYDMVDKINMGDMRPETSELLSQKPKRLLATFGSGAGNVSYFCKDEEGKNVALFKPSAKETSTQYHRGIPAGTAFTREVATSQINDVFGFDIVPKTVFRNINGMVGSYQEFVKDSMPLENYKDELQVQNSDKINKLIEKETEKFEFDLGKYSRTIAHLPIDALVKLIEGDFDAIITPPVRDELEKSVKTIKEKINEITTMNFEDDERFMKMYILDYVIGNGDRHSENVLVDKQGKIHAIDNGYSLPNYTGLSSFRQLIYKDVTESIIELKNSKFKGIKNIYKNLTNVENIKRLKERFYDTGVMGTEEFNGLVSRIYSLVQGNGILYNYIDERGGTEDVINGASQFLAGLTVDEAVTELEKLIKEQNV